MRVAQPLLALLWLAPGAAAQESVVLAVESRLIGPDRSFSLVGDSPRRDWTGNNFEGFLRQFVTIAGIKRQ